MATTILPTKMRLSIGGYFANNYEVILEGSTLRYIKNHEELTISPSDGAWQKFLDGLLKSGAEKWQKSYDNVDVLDGTQWEIKIIHPRMRINSSGSNAYPGNDKEDDSLEPSVEFMDFCQNVSELLGGLPFE